MVVIKYGKNDKMWTQLDWWPQENSYRLSCLLSPRVETGEENRHSAGFVSYLWSRRGLDTAAATSVGNLSNDYRDAKDDA